MGLNGKLVSQTSIKSDGNEFHDLVRHKPYQASEISPQIIQSVDLCSGQWGTVGSVVCWNFTQDGKKTVSKEIIEAVDQVKKSITYKVIKGDLLQLYKTFKFTVSTDANGEDNIITWTLEYEKKTWAVPDPLALRDLCLALTKDIERHHLLVPN